MGLEIAEILMDLEDEFIVVLDENTQLDGTVRSLENYVLGKFDRTRYDTLISTVNEIPYPDDHILSIGEYRLTRKTITSLPRGFICVPKEYDRKSKIRTALLALRDKYADSECVRRGVRKIIKDRLQFKRDIRPDDHIVRDLGAG